MRTRYSSGPWYVEYKAQNATELRIITPEPRHCVAVVPADDIQQDCIGRMFEVVTPTARANAVLISAAPDMLQALRRVEALLCRLDGLKSLAKRKDIAPMLDLIGAAIDKAESPS